jgi:hypothetical protein
MGEAINLSYLPAVGNNEVILSVNSEIRYRADRTLWECGELNSRDDFKYFIE